MTTKILVNHNPLQTLVAVLENNKLTDVFIERDAEHSLVGNIYLGTVIRMAKGVDAAFVDIGREKMAFLHRQDMADFKRPSLAESIAPSSQTPLLKMAKNKPEYRIDDTAETVVTENHNIVKEGQKILVQVTKDEVGTKGVRVTTNIGLVGRYVVSLPTSAEDIGVSVRLPAKEMRANIKAVLTELQQKSQIQGGMVARTSCQDLENLALRSSHIANILAEMNYLKNLWEEIQTKKQKALLTKQKHSLIHKELSLIDRFIRDVVPNTQTQVLVNNIYAYEQIKEFSQKIMPSLTPHIHQDLKMDIQWIEQEISEALDKKVQLPSGGYLVIEQTEALATIDVNTGGFHSKQGQADTVYQTNMEAVSVIAKQLRLRNISGMIVLDFIDMSKNRHREDVLNALQHELKKDYATTNISQISELGLVEMTRKRLRKNLQDTLCQTCPTCDGMGVIKSKETVAISLLDAVNNFAKKTTVDYKINKTDITIRLDSKIHEYLTTISWQQIAEAMTSRKVRFIIDDELKMHQYVIF